MQSIKVDARFRLVERRSTPMFLRLLVTRYAMDRDGLEKLVTFEDQCFIEALWQIFRQETGDGARQQARAGRKPKDIRISAIDGFYRRCQR